MRNTRAGQTGVEDSTIALGPAETEPRPNQHGREVQRFDQLRAMPADALGDDGSNDLLVSEVLRTNELQRWFVAEHLVDTPLVNAQISHQPKGAA